MKENLTLMEFYSTTLKRLLIDQVLTQLLGLKGEKSRHEVVKSSAISIL